MRRLGWLAVLVFVCVSLGQAVSLPAQPVAGEELQISHGEIGRYGGRLVVAQKSEPKTLNPVLALDAPSREVIGRMNADLIHINRDTQQTEPALAQSWKVSPDGRVFLLQLRHGLRFSDGQPFDADDVVFSFQVYMDAKLNSPQRDMLIIAGKPIAVEKAGPYAVRFTLAQPYAAAERLFDSVAMLPRHLLEKPYRDGKFESVWSISAPPAAIAGLGPFRLKEYVPGQRLVLERNPYYWKADRNKNRLPYLDEMVFLFAGNEDAQVIRFQAGDTTVLGRVGAENYALLSKDAASRGYALYDLGPSLEYNFLLFNQNDLAGKKLEKLAPAQSWFTNLQFRQAVSLAVDRNAIVRLAYAGRAVPLWGNVSPSNKLWFDSALPRPARSVEKARELLKGAGFSWRGDGQLLDPKGRAVEFTIIASASSAQRARMATIIQDDLGKLGMNVHAVSLEFRALLDRVFQTYDYEAVIMGLGGGDADPNPEMNVWLSNGSTHLWRLGENKPASAWEAELDQLMQKQMVERNHSKRKQLYDRAQQIIGQNLPFIFLATPNVLVGARSDLGNVKPALLEPNLLWNVEELYLRAATGGGR
jgi:peptide/nickel transport system substrate-binding protein